MSQILAVHKLLFYALPMTSFFLVFSLFLVGVENFAHMPAFILPTVATSTLPSRSSS